MATETEEQETLDLRLDTQDSEETPPEHAKKQFLPTQTSCISLAMTEGESSPETSQGLHGNDDAEKTTYSSGESPEKNIRDVPTTSDGPTPASAADEHNGTEERSNVSTNLDSSKFGDRGDSSDESRMESPEPPNENSELNEMDTTFMGGVSELDASSTVPREFQSEARTVDDPPDGAASDDESGMSSAKCGSDNGGDSELEDNEELREARMDEDDEPNYDNGPEIALPYKEPEQLSLHEFLARRRSKRGSSTQMKDDLKVKEVPTTETTGNPENAGPSEEQPKRTSKIREEILKAAAKVTPQLSRSSFVSVTPVDELILKAVSMQSANATSPDALKKPNCSVPGAQLKELKASLKEKIDEQRKRSRQERTKRILGKHFDGDPHAEEEEEEDYETDEEEDFDDEEAMLAKAAAESDEEPEEEREPGASNEFADEAAEEADEEEEEVEEVEEDSDIEFLSERKTSQKKKKNVVQDSDDEHEVAEAESDEFNDGDEDLDLKIHDGDDDSDDDASFMHLSQTQKPQKKKQRAGAVLEDLDLNNDDSNEVDEDLVALCSGKFATQKSAGKSSGLDHEDDEEREEEGDDDDDRDEVDGIGEANEDSDNSEREEEELDPDRKKNRPAKRREEFFDGEAELSGSDVGSDGEDEDDGMTEAEKRKFLKSLISENPGMSEEELQEQVTRLHFKQLLDEDRRDIRLMKERLLADGDLHSDGPGRERSFKWTNLSNDFVGGNDNGSDDSENEEETEEEAKWKARRLEREKQKKDAFSDSATAFGSTINSSGAGTDGGSGRLVELGCEESLSSVLKEANKTLKIVVPQRSVEGNQKRVTSGGFLNMNNAVLQRIAEKVKGTAKDKEGSQTTKNFVFRAVDKPEETSKVAKRPSSDASQSKSKRTKLEAAPTIQKSTSQRSIFSRF